MLAKCSDLLETCKFAFSTQNLTQKHFTSDSSAQKRTFETNLKNVLQNDVQQLQRKRKINTHFLTKGATEPPTFKRQDHPEFLIFQHGMPCLWILLGQDESPWPH